MKVLAVVIVLIMGLMAPPGSPAANDAPALADYGDAPDPFPSLFESGGPFHLNLDDCWIGPALTSTAEPNALVPDLDADDGEPVLVYLGPPGGDGEGWIFVPITMATAGVRFLNILIDLNSSFSWGDIGGEWISPNYEVRKSAGYWIGGFRVPDPAGQHWVRLTLSEVEITKNTPFGWDGKDTTGGTGFDVGETEDWLLEWLEVSIIPTTLKFVTVHQQPPPTHPGPAGSFDVVVSNWSWVWPVTVTGGPWCVPNPPHCIGNACPCNVIIVPFPPGTIIGPSPLPGFPNSVSTPGQETWAFQNPGSGRAWGQLDIEIEDPYPEVIIISNVGDYDGDISAGPNGVEFEVQEEVFEVGGTVHPVFGGSDRFRSFAIIAGSLVTLAALALGGCAWWRKLRWRRS